MAIEGVVAVIAASDPVVDDPDRSVVDRAAVETAVDIDRVAAADEPVIDKSGKGAFYETDLDLILNNRGIKTLIVCGVTTEVCVHTTVREANDRGYECVVPSDCVGSYFPEFQRIGLEMIKAQGGIFGWVSDAGRVIEALG